MPSQRTRLSKKLFMSLKSGQYIMDNYIPQEYEEISGQLNVQWENWKSKNGNTVTIYDSKKECLQDWWASNSASTIKSKSKAVFSGKMNKKIFMDFPNGHYLLFTQEPFDYYELAEDRDAQWSDHKHRNGKFIEVFNKNFICVMRRNEILGQGIV